jgi:hypothetical protein
MTLPILARTAGIAALVAAGCSGGEGGGPDTAIDTAIPPVDELPEHWRAGLEPGVNAGLAESYPNDEGIELDPHVLAAEDFEAGEVLIATEEDRYRLNVTVVDTEHMTGLYAGEHAWPEGLNGPTTRFVVPAWAHEDDRPAYFMRMCFKYDSSFHPGDLDRGVGVKGFGIYCEKVPANVYTPCDGTNWYDVSVQYVGWGPSVKPEANDGFLWVGHLYSYNPYPELAVPALGTVEVTDPAAGDEPYRFSAYADPFLYIGFGEWHCYEAGLYLNTPGEHDDEARFWIDGVLQSRTTHMRFRDVEDLYPTHMHLNLHRTTEDFPQTMIRWADNIVLATRYIGPVRVE